MLKLKSELLPIVRPVVLALVHYLLLLRVFLKGFYAVFYGRLSKAIYTFASSSEARNIGAVHHVVWE